VGQDPRALLASLHAAAVRGVAPFERTRDAVHAWLAGGSATRDASAERPNPEGGTAAMGSRRPRVHVIALGKASAAMASGACAALETHGLPVQGGVVVGAHLPTSGSGAPIALPASLTVRVGDHPVPGPQSLAAAEAIDDAVRAIDAGDLVVVLLSGGTTALAAAPVAELSQMLGDVELGQARLANLADTLLESGLAIHEMNAIRRRVLRWGAGRLAVAIAARGVERIPVFAISDVIGDDAAIIGSGPCTPDPFDESYFLALLDAHQVRGSLEPEMAKFLGVNGGTRVPAVPSSGHDAFSRVEYQLVGRNADAVAALAAEARAIGIEHVIVEDVALEGEAAEAGDRIARRALAAARALPATARALYVMGGEPVVNLRATYEQAWRDAEERDMAQDIDATAFDEPVEFPPGGAMGDDDEPMSGGRMQVLALAASLVLEDAVFSRDASAWRVHVLAAGTDGRDGPTDAAGAIVDASVPSAARKARRNPERDLATGRSWFSLDRADALLRTGPTGTNVMDVVAVLIDRA
jgi:glycerate 2-kinase